MKLLLLTIGGSVIFSMACLADDTFHLKHDKSGKVYGPFKFQNGSKIALGKASFTLVKPEAPQSALETKLKEIIIPELKFKDAKFTDVLNFLRRSSIELDKPGTPEAEQGVNFIIKSNPNDLPPMTLILRQVSLFDAIKHVSSLTAWSYQIEERAVVFEPKTKKVR